MDSKHQNIKNFVSFFTRNKKLTRQQQARRDKLLARDLNSAGMYSIGKQGTNEQGEASIKPETSEKKESGVVCYVPPKNLHSFLYKFNQNTVLKYTCHEIDTEETIEDIKGLCGTKVYNFKKHANLIRNSYKYLKEAFRRDRIFLDNKFIGLIEAYLGISGKPWSSLNVKTNWNSKDILAWSEENEGIIPSPSKNIARKQKSNGFKMENSILSHLTGTRILYFRDLVIYFKSLFHIRYDNSLKKILTYQNEKWKIEEKNIFVEFSDDKFNEGIDVFTDVDKLVQAYRAILRICREANPEGRLDIGLEFYEKGDGVYFTIHDLNHHYKKTLKDATKRIGESQHNLIKNQINGICNLYVEADFGNNDYARIGLWTKPTDVLKVDVAPDVTVEKLDRAVGVKYILEFKF